MLTYRSFGNLPWKVSTVGFGGAAISGEGGGYGFGAVSENDAINLVHTAIAQGINLFDTAPVYGFGTSEERLGKALRDHRAKVCLVSKGGVTWSDTKRIYHDNNPQLITTMLEDSLRRLRTDFIDIYMIHWPHPEIDIREPMRVLSTAKQQGKIRAIGLSNTNVAEIKKAAEVDAVDVIQNEFNFFNAAMVQELFPFIQERTLGVMGYGTLDKGILSGTVRRNRTFDKFDLRSRAPWWVKTDRDPKYRAMAEIQVLLASVGHTSLELALGYVLQFSELSSALCGFKSPAQLTSIIAALAHPPSMELMQQCRQITQKYL